jgi:hypothetical protein
MIGKCLLALSLLALQTQYCAAEEDTIDFLGGVCIFRIFDWQHHEVPLSRFATVLQKPCLHQNVQDFTSHYAPAVAGGARRIGWR